jgi:hypothetical protein
MDWLRIDHVGTPTDTNATMVEQQRNGVFYVVHADVYNNASTNYTIACPSDKSYAYKTYLRKDDWTFIFSAPILQNIERTDNQDTRYVSIDLSYNRFLSAQYAQWGTR